MRLSSLGTLATVFLAASAASALEFSVLGADTFSVDIGEEFVIDIALSNNNGQGVAGITGTIEGGDAFSVRGGQSASSHLNVVCLPTPTGCLGGLTTTLFFIPSDLSQGTNADPRVGPITIVNVLGLAVSVATGAADPGLIGGDLVPSDLDVVIRLAGLEVGEYVLTIGGSFSDGAATLPITGTDTVTVTVIPEPGTALLLGLGMAGLAAQGRRREYSTGDRPEGRHEQRLLRTGRAHKRIVTPSCATPAPARCRSSRQPGASGRDEFSG